MQDIYQILEALGIRYKKYQHPAVFTAPEAEKYHGNVEGAHTKNLFLRNKKGDKFYLAVVESKKRVDLKKLAALLNERKLSFASAEKLLHYLELTPGSVSPFGLINDKNKEVKVIIDQELLDSEKIGFHPNANTATLVITTDDFKKFLDWTGADVVYIEFSIINRAFED